MRILKKKDTLDTKMVPEKVVTKTLKLKKIELSLYFGTHDGSNTFNAHIDYSEFPRADYKDEGLQQHESIEASSWSELKGIVDDLLGESFDDKQI